MGNYYDEKLNGKGLMSVYNTEIKRVESYLWEEVNFVRKSLKKQEDVLEIGAGYGRIMKQLASACHSIRGIDISGENVRIGEEYLKENHNAEIIEMDVHNMVFEKKYDVILCLQNGLSAMKISDDDRIRDIINCLKPSGRIYISTYSQKFWNYRVAWFQEQSDKGLLGEIDYDKTGDGVIVCKDGFRAVTHTRGDLEKIGEKFGFDYEVIEVDNSSLFLVIRK